MLCSKGQKIASLSQCSAQVTRYGVFYMNLEELARTPVLGCAS